VPATAFQGMVSLVIRSDATHEIVGGLSLRQALSKFGDRPSDDSVDTATNLESLATTNTSAHLILTFV
jgi:hypothetical protein